MAVLVSKFAFYEEEIPFLNLFECMWFFNVFATVSYRGGERSPFRNDSSVILCYAPPPPEISSDRLWKFRKKGTYPALKKNLDSQMFILSIRQMKREQAPTPTNPPTNYKETLLWKASRKLWDEWKNTSSHETCRETALLSRYFRKHFKVHFYQRGLTNPL